jgi:hypothetical protein
MQSTIKPKVNIINNGIYPKTAGVDFKKIFDCYIRIEANYNYF